MGFWDEQDEDEEARVSAIEFEGSHIIVMSVPLEPDLPPTLSDSEREVILLALQGATNKEIAEERGSAVQTVANQIRSAFKKLDVNSRGELAAALYARRPSDTDTDTD